jgi:hypothetical protein
MDVPCVPVPVSRHVALCAFSLCLAVEGLRFRVRV